MEIGQNGNGWNPCFFMMRVSKIVFDKFIPHSCKNKKLFLREIVNKC